MWLLCEAESGHVTSAQQEDHKDEDFNTWVKAQCRTLIVSNELIFTIEYSCSPFYNIYVSDPVQNLHYDFGLVEPNALHEAYRLLNRHAHFTTSSAHFITSVGSIYFFILDFTLDYTNFILAWVHFCTPSLPLHPLLHPGLGPLMLLSHCLLITLDSTVVSI
ncbi:hypothetical protein MHYP_G00257400 [Metynnis hypsauchen]